MTNSGKLCQKNQFVRQQNPLVPYECQNSDNYLTLYNSAIFLSSFWQMTKKSNAVQMWTIHHLLHLFSVLQVKTNS